MCNKTPSCAGAAGERWWTDENQNPVEEPAQPTFSTKQHRRRHRCEDQGSDCNSAEVCGSLLCSWNHRMPQKTVDLSNSAWWQNMFFCRFLLVPRDGAKVLFIFYDISEWTLRICFLNGSGYHQQSKNGILFMKKHNIYFKKSYGDYLDRYCDCDTIQDHREWSFLHHKNMKTWHLLGSVANKHIFLHQENKIWHLCSTTVLHFTVVFTHILL